MSAPYMECMPVRLMHLLLTGFLGLLLVAIRYRCKFRNSYWMWRSETVFGPDRSAWPRLVDRWWAILQYGSWVWQNRRTRA